MPKDQHGMSKFAELLARRIQELDITLSDFAIRLTLNGYPVSTSAVSNWKAGTRHPKLGNPEYRRALAKALEMDINTMLAEIGYTVADSNRSREALLGADLIDSMPPERRRMAVEILERIAEG